VIWLVPVYGVYLSVGFGAWGSSNAPSTLITPAPTRPLAPRRRRRPSATQKTSSRAHTDADTVLAPRTRPIDPLHAAAGAVPAPRRAQTGDGEAQGAGGGVEPRAPVPAGGVVGLCEVAHCVSGRTRGGRWRLMQMGVEVDRLDVDRKVAVNRDESSD
jgi:hypothetical protein